MLCVCVCVWYGQNILSSNMVKYALLSLTQLLMKSACGVIANSVMGWNNRLTLFWSNQLVLILYKYPSLRQDWPRVWFLTLQLNQHSILASWSSIGSGIATWWMEPNLEVHANCSIANLVLRHYSSTFYWCSRSQISLSALAGLG